MAGEKTINGFSPANWHAHSPNETRDDAAMQATKRETTGNVTITTTDMHGPSHATCDALPQMSTGIFVGCASHTMVRIMMLTVAK